MSSLLPMSMVARRRTKVPTQHGIAAESHQCRSFLRSSIYPTCFHTITPRVSLDSSRKERSWGPNTYGGHLASFLLWLPWWSIKSQMGNALALSDVRHLINFVQQFRLSHRMPVARNCPERSRGEKEFRSKSLQRITLLSLIFQRLPSKNGRKYGNK